MFIIEDNPIIAAVYTNEDFNEAIKSQINVIFLLKSNIFSISNYIPIAHKHNKSIYIHVDMTEGISKDRYGIEYIAKIGTDGIISTRSNVIKYARENKLSTIQRFFIIDYHSVDTAIESTKSLMPDMIEIMPGVVPKVVTRFKDNIKIPIITGGLIETKQEVIDALKAGASAVSTSNKKLWYE